MLWNRLSIPNRSIDRAIAVKIRSLWLIRAGAWLIVWGFRALFATCRWEFRAPTEQVSLNYTPPPEDTERFILCVWHDVLLIPGFTSRHPRNACCLVSGHSDGSFLAEALQSLGYTTVRGSSRKGAVKAARQLLDVPADKHLVFTPDGPLGPRREMKAGPVYCAAETGRRIVPGAYTARRGWRVKGKWTDLLIPCPFTTVYVVSGEPISVPDQLDRDQLDGYVARLQQAMDRLQADLESEIHGQPLAQAFVAPARSRRAA